MELYSVKTEIDPNAQVLNLRRVSESQELTPTATNTATLTNKETTMPINEDHNQINNEATPSDRLMQIEKEISRIDAAMDNCQGTLENLKQEMQMKMNMIKELQNDCSSLYEKRLSLDCDAKLLRSQLKKKTLTNAQESIGDLFNRTLSQGIEAVNHMIATTRNNRAQEDLNKVPTNHGTMPLPDKPVDSQLYVNVDRNMPARSNTHLQRKHYNSDFEVDNPLQRKRYNSDFEELHNSDHIQPSAKKVNQINTESINTDLREPERTSQSLAAAMVEPQADVLEDLLFENMGSSTVGNGFINASKSFLDECDKVNQVLGVHGLELVYPEGFDKEVVDLMHKAILDHSLNHKKTSDPAVIEAILAIDLEAYLVLMPVTTDCERAKRGIVMRNNVPRAGIFARVNNLNRILKGATWKTLPGGRWYIVERFGGYLEAVFVKMHALAESRLCERCIKQGPEELCQAMVERNVTVNDASGLGQGNAPTPMTLIGMGEEKPHPLL